MLYTRLTSKVLVAPPKISGTTEDYHFSGALWRFHLQNIHARKKVFNVADDSSKYWKNSNDYVL